MNSPTHQSLSPDNPNPGIVLGDTADTLAATAVARAAKGQGHLLGDVGVSDAGLAYIMRDLGKDWVQAYARAAGKFPDAVDERQEHDDKNVNDLTRVFAAQLLESNPGGVSNILSTVGKLQASRDVDVDVDVRGDGGARSCAVCEEALCEDEPDNRCGVCDACATGVFGDWRDEEAAARTTSLLPETLRLRLN